MSKEKFGKFADRVQDFGNGELILVIGKYEIHPNGFDWAVVDPKTGRVLKTTLTIEDAVSWAENCFISTNWKRI